ncbi:hypothetical protein FT663_04323 [Candidozyma haemuli var. vulneris]|uniref:Major facilitator superfamily (MFS) profile domain-containing protein n=1 Tax=Candidozyma haemuli TaxID=45357 RepID=A0A2V1AZE1_9ASCO|nr:hypothetical protein CXQ85_002600 [[Candida] haemuloni]KAF3986601.1 hypothetical protein FT662_04469 [[Candida] haemuloni var. vulneris]KAF3987756.1 hypothetical protein FT663_04323 [[Candida] haemuloni var. vulneris]PVH22876.1 hypothetical protein CXQ85_002600 [[Candida] haemuloni]
MDPAVNEPSRAVAASDESKHLSDEHSSDGLDRRDTVKSQVQASTAKSFGIRKAELMCAQYTHPAMIGLAYLCVFFIAYTYGLDGTVRSALQTKAQSSYDQHSLLSTVNVIRTVVAAASQPTYARMSDILGRIELMVVSIIFYAVGTVISSQAFDVERFAGGSVLYQVGYSGIMLMLEVFLADLSNLNWRLFASFIPATPFIINTWVSGDVLDSLERNYSWNFGIGMWAFIFPLSCIPFLCILIHMRILAGRTPEYMQVQMEEEEHRISNNRLYRAYVNDIPRLTTMSIWKRWPAKVWHTIKWCAWELTDLFWLLDVVGILFIICVFGFILVPFTLAGGVSTKWQEASTIVPLVIGFVLIPFFVIWELKFAKFPIVPFKLLKDRGVWASLVIAMMVNLIWTLPNDYMYTVLRIGMNTSEKATIRIQSLYSFVSVIVGPMLGLVLVLVRRTKPFIIFGCATWFVATGLLFHFRGANDGLNAEHVKDGIIGALCVMGFGAGFFTYTTQLSIQTCTNHEYMAVLLSLYLATYNIGSAIGNSISGAIWTQLMYDKIVDELDNFGINNSTMATIAYSNPFKLSAEYPWGTPPRRAVAIAYADVQRKMCIAGIALCVPLLVASLLLRNHKLLSVQSLDEASPAEVGDIGEKGEKEENKDIIVVNNYDDDPIVKFFLVKVPAFFKRS